VNWVELFTALCNTAVVATGVLITSVPLATCLAVLLQRTDVLGARAAWIILSSQLVLPLIATVGAWSAGFGTQGWWPLSQAMVVRSPLTALAAVTFMHAVAAIPGAVLILSLGLRQARQSHEELAWLDGGGGNVLRRIVLPGLTPWLAATSFWVIVPVFTEMVVTNLYQVPTLPEQVYLDMSLGVASTMTYLVSLIGCVLPMCMLALGLRRHLPSLSQTYRDVHQHAPRRFNLRRWRWPVSLVLWTIVAMIVAIPSSNLLLKAGWQTEWDAGDMLIHRWTWQRFGLTLWETCSLFRPEFQWTATLAFSAATCALVAAAALRLSSNRSTVMAVINLLCLVCISLPGPLVANITSGLLVTTRIPVLGWLYDHTLAAPILAQQTRLFPIAWLLVGGIAASISLTTRELAQLDRWSWWSRSWYVIWRPTWQLWLTTWLLLMAVSAGELSSHLLLLPPGVTTLAQRLFEFLHFGMRYQDSGLCLAFVVLGWLIAIIVWNTRTGRA